MKVIRTDNYNREGIADTLIAEKVNKGNGELIAIALTNYVNDDNWCYLCVPDDYRLSRGMEDLI